MALIEIDGLPIQNGEKIYSYVSHNQRVKPSFIGDSPPSYV